MLPREIEKSGSARDWIIYSVTVEPLPVFTTRSLNNSPRCSDILVMLSDRLYFVALSSAPASTGALSAARLTGVKAASDTARSKVKIQLLRPAMPCILILST